VSTPPDFSTLIFFVEMLGNEFSFLIGWQIYILELAMSLKGGVGLKGPIRKRKIGPIGGEKKDGERGRGSVRILKESG
jgi:hypothetical protein